jgi:hypothetical protein
MTKTGSTKTGTILKALQAVLLVTVLSPAIAHADPLAASQKLAPAQTQDQPAKGEAKHINRGLILGTAQAATNPNVQRPVEIPQISAPVTTAPAPVVAAVEAPQIEIPALPPRNDDAPVTPTTNDIITTAAAPAATTSTAATLPVTTLPAPQPAADTSSTATTTANVDTAKADTTKADTTASKVTTTKAASVPTSPQHHSHSRGDDSFSVGGFNVSGSQLRKIINRSDVRSILAQYGLN